MISHTLKLGTTLAIVGAIAGGIFFGPEVFSYAKSAMYQARQHAKDAVPVQFELERARQMIDEIVPEMRASIELIATEEVAIEDLEHSIEKSHRQLASQKQRVDRLRELLSTDAVRFTLGDQTYPRSELVAELSRSFDRYRDAELATQSQQRLLATRKQNLRAAEQVLEKMRTQKVELTDRVAALEGQYRLVQAAGAGSQFALDQSKVAQAEKLIRHIKQRLDVAERVLAHETRFVEPMPLDAPVDDQQLLQEIEAHFNPQMRDVQDDPMRIESSDRGDTKLAEPQT